MSVNADTQTLVPTFRVRVNGSDLPAQAAADLLKVAVYEDVDAPGMFALRMSNWDMTKLRITWSDDQLFAAGNAVEIQMGYVDQLEALMKGEITGLEPEFVASEAPTLTVRGYDRRHRLMRGRKTCSFTQMKDSDIASKIASQNNLTAQAQDSGVVLDYVLQRNQTDLAFLQERAQRIGYEVVVDDKTLLFRPCSNTGSEVLTLTRDGDLIEFYPRLTTLNQASQVTVRGWDPKQKTVFVSQAAAGNENARMGDTASGPSAVQSAFGPADWVSLDQVITSQAEADQIALGHLNDIALGYITGEGICRGRVDLRAGAVIKIDGLGKQFSGRYYVISTTHSYTPEQGYRTAFSVRRNAT